MIPTNVNIIYFIAGVFLSWIATDFQYRRRFKKQNDTVHRPPFERGRWEGEENALAIW